MSRHPHIQIQKPPVTWIMIADGKQAQIYVRERTEQRKPLSGRAKHHASETCIEHTFVPVPRMQWEAESREQYNVGRNTTGMVFESAGTARHMSEPHMDIREAVRNRFAVKLAEQLNKTHHRKAFDRLVLIAPPKMLGEIKKHLEKTVREVIAAELPKDLTHCESESLAEHLKHLG